MNIFNKKFVDLYDQNKKHTTDKINSSNQSIFLHPVVKTDRKIKNKKSVGFEGIPVVLVRESASIIATPLTYIVTQIFVTGIYPEVLKEARIKVVYKKSDKENEENYRPVSQL